MCRPTYLAHNAFQTILGHKDTCQCKRRTWSEFHRDILGHSLDRSI